MIKDKTPKEKISKKEKAKRVASLGLVAALIITGIFAFLTATDSKDNVFKLGNVDIQLYEAFDSDQSGVVKLSDNSDFSKPDYVYKNSSDEYIETSNGEIYTKDVPSVTTEKVLPNQVIEKAPWVVNTGDNDAYIYMKVGIPVDTISTESLGSDGYFHSDNNGEAHEVEMFTLLKSDKTPGVNEGWALIPYSDSTDYEVGEKDGQTYHYYVYGYTEGNGEDGIVEPDQVTADLFSYVRFVNYDNETNALWTNNVEAMFSVTSDTADYYFYEYDLVRGLYPTDINSSMLHSGNIKLGAPSDILSTAFNSLNLLDISLFAETAPSDSAIDAFIESVDAADAACLYYEFLCSDKFKVNNFDEFFVGSSLYAGGRHLTDAEMAIVAEVATCIVSPYIDNTSSLVLTSEEETTLGITNSELQSFLNKDASYTQLANEEKKALSKKATAAICLKLGISGQIVPYTYNDLLAYTNERIEYCQTHTVTPSQEIDSMSSAVDAMLRWILGTQQKDTVFYISRNPYRKFNFEDQVVLIEVPYAYRDIETLEPNNVRDFLDDLGLGFWYNVFSAYYNHDTNLNNVSSTCGDENNTVSTLFAGGFSYNGYMDNLGTYFKYSDENLDIIDAGIYATALGRSERYYVSSSVSGSEPIALSDIKDEYDIPINAYGVQVNNKNYSTTTNTEEVFSDDIDAYLINPLAKAMLSTYEGQYSSAVESGIIDSYTMTDVSDNMVVDISNTYSTCHIYDADAENPFVPYDVTALSDIVKGYQNAATHEDSFTSDVDIENNDDIHLEFAGGVVQMLTDNMAEEPDMLQMYLDSILADNDSQTLDDNDEIYILEMFGEPAIVYVTGDKTWDLTPIDYDGFVVSGEGLHIYEPSYELYNETTWQFEEIQTEYTGEFNTPENTVSEEHVEYIERWVKVSDTPWTDEELASIDVEDKLWNFYNKTSPANSSSYDTQPQNVTPNDNVGLDFVGSYLTYNNISDGQNAKGVHMVNVESGTFHTKSAVDNQYTVFTEPGLYVKLVGYGRYSQPVIGRLLHNSSKTTTTYSSTVTDQTGTTAFETLANTWEYASGKCNW